MFKNFKNILFVSMSLATFVLLFSAFTYAKFDVENTLLKPGAIPTSEDAKCVTYLKSMFKTWNQSSKTDGVVYSKYIISSTLNGNSTSNNISSKSEIESISFGNKSRVYSKEMIVLRDEKYTISILPQKKIVFWTNSIKSKVSLSTAQAQISKMQDSLLSIREKIVCEAVKGKKNSKVVHVYLKYAKGYAGQLTKLSYYINTATKTLQKLTMNYTPESEFKKISYEFIAQNYNYKKVDMKTPVKQLVFTSNNTLLQKYAGFKLIDNRK